SLRKSESGFTERKSHLGRPVAGGGQDHAPQEALPQSPLSLRQRQSLRSLLLGQGLRVGRGRGGHRINGHPHNQQLLPEKDLAEWDAAIEEYERKHGRREGTG